jgi:hypothetical protein
MGFSLKGLTSHSLAANNTASVNANNADVANVPASYYGRTSTDAARPNEKTGAPHDSSASSSDLDLTKVDTTAERGVQNVQAMTQVWSKRDLIMAYVL